MNVDRVEMLAKVLSAFRDTSVSDFRARLILQKRVYLLQILGADLNYRFNWYLRGPYSPDLTRDAFTLLGRDNAASEATVPHNFGDIIKDFKVWAGSRSDDARWLEIVASLHYLMSAKLKSTDINSAMTAKMTDLKPDELSAAEAELRQHRLLPA